MSKVKLISSIAIGLLIVNLAILAFLFFNRPGHPGGEGPRKMVIKKLGFDDSQIASYDALIETHKKEIKGVQEDLKKTKKELFSTLRSDHDATDENQLIEHIGGLQMRMEQIHYAHFQALKSICKPDQMAAYNELCLEIAGLFDPLPPKRK